MTTGLAFATVPGRQTDQAESVGLESYRMGSDEEESRRRADEDFVVE